MTIKKGQVAFITGAALVFSTNERFRWDLDQAESKPR